DGSGSVSRVIILDGSGGKELSVREFPQNVCVGALSFSPDSKSLAIATAVVSVTTERLVTTTELGGYGIKIWSLEEDRVKTFNTPKLDFNSVPCWTADGRTIAVETVFHEKKFLILPIRRSEVAFLDVESDHTTSVKGKFPSAYDDNWIGYFQGGDYVIYQPNTDERRVLFNYESSERIDSPIFWLNKTSGIVLDIVSEAGGYWEYFDCTDEVTFENVQQLPIMQGSDVLSIHRKDPQNNR
ncbi:MAG: hypothetical protein KC931_18690, partial [Candidatus Omnitrophica bacterium]|nr:hypothetical protein [Candidatus Omnitrophota bacterium]